MTANPLRETIAAMVDCTSDCIEHVDVYWDNGERYDDIAGESANVGPTFEITVTYWDDSGNHESKRVEPAPVLTALLNAVLGLDDHR